MANPSCSKVRRALCSPSIMVLVPSSLLRALLPAVPPLAPVWPQAQSIASVGLPGPSAPVWVAVLFPRRHWMPPADREYLAFLEQESGARIGMISTGPGRGQSLFVDEFADELKTLGERKTKATKNLKRSSR